MIKSKTKPIRIMIYRHKIIHIYINRCPWLILLPHHSTQHFSEFQIKATIQLISNDKIVQWACGECITKTTIKDYSLLCSKVNDYGLNLMLGFLEMNLKRVPNKPFYRINLHCFVWFVEGRKWDVSRARIGGTWGGKCAVNFFVIYFVLVLQICWVQN